MAFNTTKSTNSKNSYVASISSIKTEKPALWINIVDSFALNVVGKKLEELTPEEAKDLIIRAVESEHFQLVVKDVTQEKELVDIDNY